VTTLKDNGLSQLKQLFVVLNELQEQTIFIYPNCDAGSKEFIDLINSNNERKYLHIFKNLPYLDYLSLLKSCDVMIGNSSSGIIEAPSFQIPVINIGNRQKGRERSDNIIDVDSFHEDIRKSIEFALNDTKFKQKIRSCTNKFGDGKASEGIVKILKEMDLSEKIIQKQITY
jgi:UDP-N-acetylglucosamine 2-epimerase (non-hydrolysing)/GDP/UDP-N,N'-diacetylbacillosamine 2-epimerase (hydrolysing)